MRLRFLIPLLALSFAVSACGGDSDGDATPVHVDSTTSAVPTALAPPPPQHTSGLFPKVTFDPCTQIDDETIRKIGLDPDSRKRSDNMGDPHTKLACFYKGEDRSGVIGAMNSPFVEEQARTAPNSRPVTINGRESLIGTSIVNTSGCTVEMRTSFGEVIIDVANSSAPKMRDVPPCDGVTQMAEMIERTIPKGT